MTFSSLTFLCFFAVVYLGYWLLRKRTAQNLFLVIVSYAFYGWWDYRFCALMLASSLLDFGIGAALYRESRPKPRRFWLVLSVVSNLAVLGFFKYYNFFIENLAQIAMQFGLPATSLTTLSIILPLGISFYTFQTLSYTIDIYRGQLAPTRSLVDYLAFVSFFPQLVAGPIERASNLLGQFSRPREFDPVVAGDGARQALWGLFKKLAIADRLAPIVDAAYSNPSHYSGPALAFATVCFAFQIYCDFSGYSDIAIGVARQFNIQLTRNFAYPYFSQGIQEFWRRWHISLSFWLRDYVYIPLGGSRGGPRSRSRNILLTFLISGFWHGAAWTYAVWGLLHGVLNAFLPRFARAPAQGAAPVKEETFPGGAHLLPRPLTLLRMLATFSVVCLCWVFFRARGMSDAVYILRTMRREVTDLSALQDLFTWIQLERTILVTTLVLAGFVMIEWFSRRHEHPLKPVARWPLPLRWTGYTLLLWSALFLIPEGTGQEFIYFDF